MAGIFGSTYGLNLARGTIAAPTLGTRPTLAGFGSFGDDETDSGASIWDQVVSFTEGVVPGVSVAADAYDIATSGGGSSAPSVQDDGSCDNLPTSPSGLSCRYGFAPAQRTTNTGKTCYTCAETPTQGGSTCPPGMIPNPVTKGCSNPSTGGGVPDVVNGKVYCPGGGVPDAKGVCPVIPKTPSGSTGTAGTPKPVAPVEQPETSNVGLYALAGALVLGGVGYIVYKKKQKAKGYSSSY